MKDGISLYQSVEPIYRLALFDISVRISVRTDRISDISYWLWPNFSSKYRLIFGDFARYQVLKQGTIYKLTHSQTDHPKSPCFTVDENVSFIIVRLFISLYFPTFFIVEHALMNFITIFILENIARKHISQMKALS